jgi:hypothetical protein
MAAIERSDAAPSAHPFSELRTDNAAERRAVIDDSAAAMQRLRIPFETDPADAPAQPNADVADGDR